MRHKGLPYKFIVLVSPSLKVFLRSCALHTHTFWTRLGYLSSLSSFSPHFFRCVPWSWTFCKTCMYVLCVPFFFSLFHSPAVFVLSGSVMVADGDDDRKIRIEMKVEKERKFVRSQLDGSLREKNYYIPLLSHQRLSLVCLLIIFRYIALFILHPSCFLP